jgi:hypothetical protein
MNCKEMCVLDAILTSLRYGFANVEHLGYSFRIVIDEDRERCMRVGSYWWLMLTFS